MNKKLKQRLQDYPAIEDLKKRAKTRIPHVSWAYLICGTGDEKAVLQNEEAFAKVSLLPRFMKGYLEADLTTTLLGKTYNAPFGVAPIGLTGLMWPRAENILAKMAADYRIPYCLSTVATQTPEDIGPLAGDMGWFQLYPPREKALRSDLLKRAKTSGFQTLVVTADVPAPSRRERASRAGLRMPPRITPHFILQGIRHPQWSLETLKAGLPSLKTMEKYTQSSDMAKVTGFVGAKLGGTLSWEYLKEVRDEWEGDIIIKGLLHPEDAEKAIEVGVDGIQVSNHGARQFNGTPAAIDALEPIVEQVQGRVAVLFDSGVRSGLDIVRALAVGADFVFLGRAFIYGVAAFGQEGGAHVTEILRADLISNMLQLGVSTIDEVKALQPIYKK